MEDMTSRLGDLERARDEIQAEIDVILAELVGDDGDDFAMQLAERFMRQRDEARAEVVKLKAGLWAQAGEWEVKYNALHLRASRLAAAVENLVNTPLNSRADAQGLMLLALDRYRES